MDVNERIKKVRRALDLTQKEFGDRIGIKRNSVALIENGRSTSDQTIFSICREFDVNEEWLRNGEGEMFKAKPNTILDAMAEKYGYTHRDYVIVEKFSNLSRRERDVILDFLTEVASGCADIKEDTPAMPGKQNLPLDQEVSDLEEEYKKSRSGIASKTDLSASSTTEEKPEKKQA